MPQTTKKAPFRGVKVTTEYLRTSRTVTVEINYRKVERHHLWKQTQQQKQVFVNSTIRTQTQCFLQVNTS